MGALSGPVEWAAAARPMPGETVNGDAWLVAPAGPATLVAVIDGLGHGPAAAAAAQACAGALRAEPEAELPVLMRAADRAARGTRGAALTLARFTPGAVELLAIGNVSGVIARPAQALRRVPLRSGIVGSRIPSLRHVERLPLGPGDCVVLASDGIRSGFSAEIDPGLAPAALAEQLLAAWARDGDDATVLVARMRRD